MAFCMPLLGKCILGNVVCDVDLRTRDLENVVSVMMDPVLSHCEKFHSDITMRSGDR